MHSAQLKYYAAVKIAPKLRKYGFTVPLAACIPTGTPIRAAHFIPGQLIDVQGKTIGKGFQGGMKRHGFAGMPASHGVSLSHRHIGAIGCREDPSGVKKGKKMPGRMGNKMRSQQYLQVHQPTNKNILSKQLTLAIYCCECLYFQTWLCLYCRC